MQKYKEINGNDYVKDSRTTINETMRSIQSMNSGTAFPTINLFDGMKCYRTDLKKTYTLIDSTTGKWVEDAIASQDGYTVVGGSVKPTDKSHWIGPSSGTIVGFSARKIVVSSTEPSDGSIWIKRV